MAEQLRPGQVVHTEPSGLPCTVETFLGGGGQGEVYRATLADRQVALKWYLPGSATAEQRGALGTLIRRGPPTGAFLWPLELATEPDVAGFGYVMPLREIHFRGIIDLMKARVSPSFRVLATTGLELADSYFQLHAQGLCYRDISFGNVFFDPESGRALICDNDNVAVDGAGLGGVLGTPRFMAPEIVRGEALPSSQTDLYSLAVLLFYILMVHHPLEGQQEADIRCMDLPAMNLLYGIQPRFIFDPDDASNRPVPGCHDNAIIYWPLYPGFVRELFTQSFTRGLREPQGRVRETLWRAAMARLRDSILYCASCDAENFYDAEAMQARGGTMAACWSCAQPLRLPARLRVGRSVVMLNHDTELYPHHLDHQRLYDFSQPVASVVRHPKEPSVWGLQNRSPEKWVITGHDGTLSDVPPGRSVTLAAGIKIHFGRSDAEVRV